MRNKTDRKKTISLVVLILWTAFVLAGYYYYHKPINTDLISRLLSTTIDWIAGLGIVLLAGGIGRKFLPVEELSKLEQAAIQAALGGAALGMLWLGLGVVHLYMRWVAWFLFLILGILYRKETVSWIHSLSEVGKSWKRAGRIEKSCGVIIGILVLFQLFFSSAPPLKWDALTYHLQLPRQYLDAGYLISVPTNPYWGHPQIVEMLFTFSLALNRFQTAAVTGWGFGVVFFLGVIGFTNRLCKEYLKQENENAGWVAAAALIAGFTTRYLLGWAYTDLFAALFGLAGLILFFGWLDKKAPSWFRWSIVFASLAATVKWTNGVLLIGMLLCLPFIWKSKKLSFRSLVEGAAFAFTVAFPWLLKNFIVTGNPIFPYLIPTEYFSAARVAMENGPLTHVKLWKQVLLPISITFTGVDTAEGFSTDPGSLLLLLGTPGLVFFWRERRIRLLVLMLLPAAFAIGFISLYSGHLLQPRLYYSVLALMAIPAGLGWLYIQNLRVSGVRMRRIVGVVTILVLLLCVIQDTSQFSTLNPVHAILSDEAEAVYFKNGIGVYSEAMESVNNLSVDEKVLMLWEPRGLYMPLGTRSDFWIDQFQIDFFELGKPEKIIQRWCDGGYTRVLVYKPGEELIKIEDGTATTLWDAYQSTTRFLESREVVNKWYDLYQLSCPAHP